MAGTSQPQSDASGELDAFGQHPADIASESLEREIDLSMIADREATDGDVSDQAEALVN